MTDAIYFDREMLNSLKFSNFWWKMTWIYRSNWRILHIDGFERNPFSMPITRGQQRTFFNYAEVK